MVTRRAPFVSFDQQATAARVARSRSSSILKILTPMESMSANGRPRARAHFLVALALLFSTSRSSARAQSVGVALRSAEQARAAWVAARRALANGDSAAAQALMANAAALWPQQGAYARGALRLAAQRRDAPAVAAALTSLTSVGLGITPEFDPLLNPYSRDRRMSHVLAMARSLGSSRGASTVHLRYEDSTFFPEGLAKDPRSGVFYISSARSGRVVAVTSRGARREPFSTAMNPSHLSALGVAVDTARNVLWVATAGLKVREAIAPALIGKSALVALDLTTGVARGEWWVPSDGKQHAFGDVALAQNGDVFVSDGASAAIYRLRGSLDEALLEVFASGPLLRNPQGLFVADERASAVFVADYVNGLLVAEEGSVVELSTPNNLTALGIDGVCSEGDRVYAVQNGVTPPRLIRLTIDRKRRALLRLDVLDQQPVHAPEPTQCTAGKDAVYYLANSQWELRAEDGTPLPGARLQGPRVRRVRRAP